MLLIAVLFLLLIPVFLSIYRLNVQKTLERLPRAPGRWIPFFGNVRENFYANGDQGLLEEQRRSGSDAVTACHFWARKYHFIITSFDLAKEIFINHAEVSSERFPPMKGSPLYKEPIEQGILNANGSVWREHRRTVMKSLRNLGMGKNKLEAMLEEESKYLVDAIRETYAKSTECPTRCLYTASTNIICQLCFGIRFDYNDKSFQKIFEAFQTIFSSRHVNFKAFIPSWVKNIPFVRSAKIEKLIYSIKAIISFCTMETRKYKKFMSSEEYVRGALEECLLEKLLLTQKEIPDLYSDAAVQSIVMDLFSAGTDTTSTTMKWALLYLKNHQEVQQNIRNEIFSVIGSSRTKFQHLELMPYTNAFMLETSRFCCTAHRSLVHKLVRSINTKDYLFPEGSMMQVSIFCIHRDRNTFKNPDNFDVNNFYENGKVINNESLIPFSLGSRICPGEKLAKMEIFFFLIAILKNFKLEYLPGDKMEDDNSIQGFTRAPADYQIKITPL